MIIAIDGPAGSGKSTIAKRLAMTLGFTYLDTGAMYRALTLKVIESKKDPHSADEVVRVAETTQISLSANPDGTLAVFLDGRDVSPLIRQPRVSALVSHIVKVPGVRAQLLRLQRSLGGRGNCILDGRDIGTVVFPDAEKKFFLDARFDERVARRYEELKGLGEDVSCAAVEKDLKNRDTIDSTRECAPLRKAEDAIYIDTTDLSIEEVTQRVLSYLR